MLEISKSRKRTFKVVGMDCVEEVTLLKKELTPLVKNEDRLLFNIMEQRLTILDPDGDVDSSIVINRVAKLGMKAIPWEDRLREREMSFWQRHRQAFLTSSSGVLILTAFFFHWWRHESFFDAIGAAKPGTPHGFPVVSIFFYIAGSVVGAWFIVPKAFLALRRLRPDMNLLMTVAVLGAMAIGEWFEAATVTFLYSLSLLLESWSVDRARKATKKLLELAPEVARIISDDGIEKSIPVSSVTESMEFVVKPGERIPLDGTITSGSSEINQAPITGESLPVARRKGDNVFAGTINGAGAIQVKCTKTAEHSILAGIVKLVSESHAKRASVEQWVEKFAHYYTPLVMGLALVAFVLPPLAFQGDWVDWLYRALVLLVIACPCALVISTPVSIVAALTSAARNGVLVKGGKYLEIPARLSAIAFDKTGTLTEGRPSVSEIVPLNGHTEKELLEIATAIEVRSEHPIAHAIVARAKELGVRIKPGDDFVSLQGKGATARIDGKTFWVGSHVYLEERGQETKEVHDKLEAMSDLGHTVLAIGNETHVCGLISVSDTVRPDAASVLSDLKARNLHTVMLTGDNWGTAKPIAQKIKVNEFFAELLPAEKVKKVGELTEKFGMVAMVGDGVNDAPAMARATLGIAMGAGGSDAAIESADIALMSDDLSRITWLIRKSKRTISIIRQNVILSLAVKVTFLILTFSGHASLWSAIAADTGASLLVIANGLRLLN